MIYHLVPAADWERSHGKADYTAPSLASQGFLHASVSLGQLLWVANRLYRNVSDLAVLCIDEARVTTSIRYEGGGHEQPFPHIYGPLNMDAVIEVRRLRKGGQGRWEGWAG